MSWFAVFFPKEGKKKRISVGKKDLEDGAWGKENVIK